MARPIFTIEQVTGKDTTMYLLIRFEIPNGITSPDEFAMAAKEVESDLTGNLPVLFNGRGPIWGYGMLFHLAHATPAIAAYDPRLGYVVIQSHDPRFHVGQILSIEA